MQRLGISFLLVLSCLIIGCNNAPQETANKAAANNVNAPRDPNKRIKIGFAMDTVKEERWRFPAAHC